MGRYADEFPGTDDETGARGGEIVLAHVDTVETRGETEVGAIVEKKSHLRRERAFQFAGVGEDLPGGAELVAVLNEGDASGCEFSCEVENPQQGVVG
jgi:hypothetical protein